MSDRDDQKKNKNTDTDTDKNDAKWNLRRVLQRAVKEMEDDKGLPAQPALLLTTGSMNPIHIGHINMMYAARDRLQQEGYEVVHGWISPSNDLYVESKARSKDCPWMSSRLRMHMTRLALEDHDWLSCSTWESEVEGQYWPDFPEVAEDLKACLQAIADADPSDVDGWVQSLAERMTIFYVAGQDHFVRGGLQWGLHIPRIGVVCVQRQREKDHLRERPHDLILVASQHEQHHRRSSTVVRRTLREGNAVGDHVPPACADALASSPLSNIFRHGHFSRELTLQCEEEYFAQLEGGGDEGKQSPAGEQENKQDAEARQQ